MKGNVRHHRTTSTGVHYAFSGRKNLDTKTLEALDAIATAAAEELRKDIERKEAEKAK